MKVLDLFSGIGGFSLGLERAGMETVAFCEKDIFCKKVLNKHWPNVPIYDDIKETFYVTGVDVITAGFPCQPFSSASRGRKLAEDLWPYLKRFVDLYLPKYLIAENVAEEPIERAANHFERLGYKTWTRCIGADAAGADHKRNRWWVCAYPNDKSELCDTLNAKVALLQELCEGLWGAENYARTIRVSHGVSHRVDRLKSLGNTVLPAIPEVIGRAIMSVDSDTWLTR